MSQFSQQKIDEQYQKLPPELKEAMFSADIAGKIFELRKKHNLTIEESGFVAEETGFVVLGLVRPRELPQKLAERLNFPEEEVEEIVQDINKEIFFPLREALKKAHRIEISEVAKEAKPSFGQISREMKQDIEKSAPPLVEGIARIQEPPSPVLPRPAQAPAAPQRPSFPPPQSKIPPIVLEKKIPSAPPSFSPAPAASTPVSPSISPASALPETKPAAIKPSLPISSLGTGTKPPASEPEARSPAPEQVRYGAVRNPENGFAKPKIPPIDLRRVPEKQKIELMEGVLFSAPPSLAEKTPEMSKKEMPPPPPEPQPSVSESPSYPKKSDPYREPVE